MRLEAVKHGEPLDHRVAVAWNEKGIAHMMRKEYVEAKGCFQTSMGIYRGLGPFQEDSLPVVNKATAEWLMGNFAVAERMLHKELVEKAADEVFR